MSTLTREAEKQVWAHFPEIHKKIIDYATNQALEHSKYIFISSGPVKKGYCTHCNHWFYLEGQKTIKQNDTGNCPHCHSKCMYKKSWVGRKYLRDSAEFLWFEKSLVDPQMVIASWVRCSRDYSESYEKVQTKCNRITLYTFKLGKSEMYEVYVWNNNMLQPRASVHDKHVGSIAVESLADAVIGTPFQYSGWEKYRKHVLVRYLALFSEMTNIEILSKHGFTDIVEAKIFKRPLHRTINWQAYKIHDFLKLSKQDYIMIQQTEKNMYVPRSYRFAIGLWLWQQGRKEKSNMPYEQMMQGCSVFEVGTHFNEFKKIKKHCTIHRIFNYAQKQFELNEKHYRRPSQVLITWADYINDCKKLELDLTNEIILFPKNLKKAHEKTMKLVQIKHDEIANRKIQLRYERLEHLVFEADGLNIRPPRTFGEIIDEGKKLNHCVGSYAERYSNGECTLLFIRKTDAPNIPFYTVEIRGETIIQVRGIKNKAATKEVEMFIEAFKKQKLTKKARKVV